MRRLLIYCLFVLVLNSHIVYAQVLFEENTVWALEADAGIAEHFVYGLEVGNNGVILAFSEGRIRANDTSPHHIVLKRSLDKGKTWLPSQILAQSNNNECYANPTPVKDPATGNITLFYALNLNNERTKVFFIISKDEGLTWSKPLEITALFNSDPLLRPFHLPGPGHGIALKNGRLIVQVWHRFSVKLPLEERRYGVSVIYSDDQGKSWKAGGYMPYNNLYPANESRIVETSDGKIILNGRYATGKGNQYRILTYSNDNGLNWSEGTYSSFSTFTPVDAGLNKLTIGRKTYQLFSYPAGPGRNNLMISISEDEGKTWLKSKLIAKGPVNYSDIAILPDQTILVLYGKGNPKYVVNARFNLEWILK
ncbi:MAG: sialidase family protein [Bacteroidota bacterium]